MLILGIESSCDDTAAAVLQDEKVLANVAASQDAIHSRFGGVVPELASRNHLRNITGVVHQALACSATKIEEIDLIAVTQGPGLIGSLLVGFSFAKSLATVTNTAFVGVDHMAGHILSVLLNGHAVDFPFLSLVVSGGTTALYLAESKTRFHCLGRTRDDAAGEAFDKTAKLLGLPYPGGPHISKLAATGDSSHTRFPRSWLEEGSLDFSFSGLKTAVLQHVQKAAVKGEGLDKAGICASFEQAVVDVLVQKTIKAARLTKVGEVVVCGGVSANPRLRKQLEAACLARDLHFHAPDFEFCTDNGAMIALAGAASYEAFGETAIDSDVYSRPKL